jgi:hypothetical protein
MLLKNAGAAPFLSSGEREHLAGPARTGKAAVRFGRTWAISPAGLEAYLATPRRPGPKPRTKKAG